MQPVRREVGGAPRNVRTVEHEEAVLNVFEEDGTRTDNRRHPYHYTRVQHLLPEDYPIRREFCLWLINQNEADPHFLSWMNKFQHDNPQEPNRDRTRTSTRTPHQPQDQDSEPHTRPRTRTRTRTRIPHPPQDQDQDPDPSPS
ncbi:hypothetical protein GEV33_005775 [Tenebrio molitor]|uniref:Uncharacterized protein n=1 Tax=Tenebrio molitor TaxID=7067 RepID=A0A8J6HN44_TENMO|nr:hypothetical protein GEV33_005775 [Tenebrio molitor]